MGSAEVEILWEDSQAFVVLKPAGLPTQAARGIASLETRLRDQLTTADTNPYLAFAHRLDRAVSGAVLICSKMLDGAMMSVASVQT